MKRALIIFCFLVATVPVTAPTYAQLWSGLLDRSRATDWSQVGVIGGIPNRTNQCGATIAAYSGSAAAINTAIQNCHAAGGGVVQLGPGTFNLTDSIGFNLSSGDPAQNVTLRGAGPDQTQLVFTNRGGNVQCTLNAGLICIASRVEANGWCSWATATQNTANWSGPYGAGTSQITLDNIKANGSGNPVNLAVGMYIVLDQLDTPADNTHFTAYAPFNGDAAGYGHTDGSTTGALPCLGGRSGRCLAEYHKVTAISGTGPYTVTITPPVNYTFFNSDGNNNPQAWWCDSLSQMAVGDGVENLTINNQLPQSIPQNFRGLIQFGGAYQSWVKNVRSIRSSSSHVFIFGGANIEVRDSYFYANDHQNSCADGGPISDVTYGMDQASAGLVKYENNIFHQLCAPMMAQPCYVCIFGYNFVVGNLPQVLSGTPFVFHSLAPNHVGAVHNLLAEGNEGTDFNADHGTAHGYGSGFMTVFRNRFTGYQATNPLGGAQPQPRMPAISGGMTRFQNFIGNVIGDPAHVALRWQYETSPVSGGVDPSTNNYTGYMWGIGWSGGSGPNDPVSYNSAMRWGNFDYVTNAVRWSTGEIPSGQFVPPQALPPSLYLFGKPAWFGNQPWPAIGPDVTGGTDPSGHAANIPAKNCFLNVMKGPADGSGAALTFNGANCYGSTNQTPPAAPTGLKVS
jgi:hypothetical protein